MERTRGRDVTVRGRSLIGRWLRQRRLWVAVGLLLLVLAQTQVAWANDPTGEATLEAGGLGVAIDFTWTLVAAFLVFLMQAGFALLEAGATTAKNTGSVFMKNMMDFIMGGLAFWAFGFALMFGGSGAASGLETGNSWFGLSGFFLTGQANDVATMELWIFQLVFAATAATIVSGALAERARLDAYMAYSFLISALIYPIYGHWVWGGGWLANLPFGSGAVDFAGSGVVHAVGGIAALVGAVMVGPRQGKFDADGRPRTIPGHNMGYVVLGTMILFFGWFGFNGGSTLAATDLRISVIVVNTFLAGVAGGAVAYYVQLVRTGKADVAATASGVIGGLVGITAPAAFVDPWAAVVIGGLAGALVIWSAGILERRFKVDDPVWAVACHGVGGLWGLLAVGIFANGAYGGVAGLIVGETGQILAQLISMAAVVVWTASTSWIVFAVLRRTMGLRVPAADETSGLDFTEFVQPGYVLTDTAG